MNRRDDSPTDRLPGIDPAAHAGRREPVFDADGTVQLRARPQPPRWRPPSRRWLPWVAAVLALVILVVAFREPLADRLWPETRAQATRTLAERALAENRLTADDGSGARELFEAALAIDPDHTLAREGLMRVAQAALEQARTAVAANRFADAHRHLALARELDVPAAAADAVAEDLRQREAAHAGLGTLLARADAARDAGRIDGDADAALPLYQHVLELQPDRADALRAREDILAGVLEDARAALRDGDLAGAAAGIDIARRYDGGHVDLPDTLARLTEEADAIRRRADVDLGAGRLARAEAGYRALLQLDDEDAAAAQGLVQVGLAHAEQAERLAADFRFDDASLALGEARRLAPEAGEVHAAAAHIARARQVRAQLARKAPTRDRARRIRSLLDEAAAAEARGDLLTPPGESAFDKLGAARALDPGDAGVRRASARLLPAARSCFDRQLRANDLGRARACLDARQTLGDDAVAVAQARRRLAERWLAIGDERLAAGELQRARAALRNARENDPAVPGLAAFEDRLAAAMASRN